MSNAMENHQPTPDTWVPQASPQQACSPSPRIEAPVAARPAKEAARLAVVKRKGSRRMCRDAAPAGRKPDRADDEQLPDIAAVLTAMRRILFGPVDGLALIRFDQVDQGRPIRINHGAAQLVEQEASRLVTAEPKLGLQILLEWVVTISTAVNHSISGSLLQCVTLPAVTEDCRPQPLTRQLPALQRDEPVRPAHSKQLPGAG
jgi:hypothetical protein